MSKNKEENRFNAAQDHFFRIKEKYWPTLMLFIRKGLVPSSPGYPEFEYHMQRFLSELQSWYEKYSRPEFVDTPENLKDWVEIQLEALELIKTTTGDFPVEKAKEAHQQGMKLAVHIRSLNPPLPKVPLIIFDPGTPTMGLLLLKEWCSDTQEQIGIEQNIAPIKRQWIKKGIYSFIILLAALLTCIYLLWWLWTNFLSK